MLISRREGNHGFTRKHPALRHQNWDMALDSADAELTVGVGAPYRDRAIRT